MFLHIGLAKTGTSFLQTTLSNHRDYFCEQGLYFPRAGTHRLFQDGGHHLLPIAFMLDRWEELALQIDYDDASRAWDDLLAELSDAPDGDVLISSEWFAFDVYRRVDLQRLKERLADYDVYVVLVLRDIVDFVNSVYAQRVRDGYEGSVADFISLAWPHLNWAWVFDRWTYDFGADRIITLRYDDLRDGDYVAEFTRRTIGRSIASPPTMQPTTRTNLSISAAATEMLIEINRSTLAAEKKEGIRDYVASFYGSMPGKRNVNLLSQDLQDILRLRCEWPALRDG